MLGIIVSIIWIIFILNLLALIGCIGFGRSLLSRNSNLLLLRAIIDPKGTEKLLRRTAGDAVRYAAWTIGSAAVLILMYL